MKSEHCEKKEKRRKKIHGSSMLCLHVTVTVTVTDNAKTTNGNNVIAITPKRKTIIKIIKINERKTRINICLNITIAHCSPVFSLWSLCIYIVILCVGVVPVLFVSKLLLPSFEIFPVDE